MTTTRRLLVTGSRDWKDHYRIADEITRAMTDLTPPRRGQLKPNDGDWIIVHGDCPTGADFHAQQWAFAAGYPVGAHPADWPTCGPRCRPQHRKQRRDGTWYCPSAGHRRNAEMVALGADICLAFIRNGSPGATSCADLAETAGIPTRRFTQEDR